MSVWNMNQYEYGLNKKNNLSACGEDKELGNSFYSADKG